MLYNRKQEACKLKKYVLSKINFIARMPLDIKKDLRMKFLKEKAWKKI
jgi:hypothetical protein